MHANPEEVPILDLDTRSLIAGAAKLAGRFGDEAYFAALLLRSGAVEPQLPHRIGQTLLGLQRYGLLGGATVGARSAMAIARRSSTSAAS